jgi:hypothetical protein
MAFGELKPADPWETLNGEMSLFLPDAVVFFEVLE